MGVDGAHRDGRPEIPRLPRRRGGRAAPAASMQPRLPTQKSELLNLSADRFKVLLCSTKLYVAPRIRVCACVYIYINRALHCVLVHAVHSTHHYDTQGIATSQSSPLVAASPV